MPLQAPASHTALSGRPATSTLAVWSGVVLALHLLVLLGLNGTWDWPLHSATPTRVGPMQTRTLARTVTLPVMTTRPAPTVAPQTRLAQVRQPALARKPKPPIQATPNTPEQDTAQLHTEAIASSADNPAQDAPAQDASSPAATAQASPPAATPALPPAEAQAPMLPPAVAAAKDTPAPTPSGSATPLGDAPATGTPNGAANANMDLPGIPMGTLASSTLLSYDLTGQEKGIRYTATGTLSWQHNATDYNMALSVKAFLLGSRHWRSQGHLSSKGLEPIRFSDSWRSERATHFDHPGQRIIFSSNAPTAQLQSGVQDQISLYAQLAAAMTGRPERFKPGSRLQIQIATVRDALPWLLTLEKTEIIQVNGSPLQATKWVCQPRNRYDAQVEFWVTPEHQWLPVRIRITQTNGNFIDLNLNGQSPLPPLPSGNAPT